MCLLRSSPSKGIPFVYGGKAAPSLAAVRYCAKQSNTTHVFRARHERTQIYTPEQFQRLQGWAARAETGAAMKHLWSPAEGAFLSRYTSATTNTVRQRGW